jgi:hypothetical protein
MTAAIFRSLLLLSLALFSCSRQSDAVRLSKSEIMNKQFSEFEGIYGGMYFAASAFDFYTSMRFTDSTLTATVRTANAATGYTFTNITEAYILDEVSGAIRRPRVDSFIINGTKLPYYKSDWVLQTKNDTLLVFKRMYADTTSPGIYEPRNTYLALRKM